MKLSQIGEFRLIQELSKIIGKPSPRVSLGIGDDAAVIKIKDKKSKIKTNELLLITTDTLVENVHFKFSKSFSFINLGYKALAINISDIAAMGGIPTFALLTIGANKNFSVKKIKDIYRGIKKLAKKHEIDIVGGDTVSSPKELIISITLLGEVEKKYLLTRSGAKVGEQIIVTGKFGGPAYSNFEHGPQNTEHRLKEARKLAKSKLVNSMIDSSDGLMRSVSEICKASKVGAKIWIDEVPRAKGATIKHALYGGEEYELIFTVPKEKVFKLKKIVKAKIVGEIVSKGQGIKLVDKHGKIEKPMNRGFEHFQ